MGESAENSQQWLAKPIGAKNRFGCIFGLLFFPICVRFWWIGCLHLAACWKFVEFHFNGFIYGACMGKAFFRLWIFMTLCLGHKKLIPLNAVDSLYYDLLFWEENGKWKIFGYSGVLILELWQMRNFLRLHMPSDPQFWVLWLIFIVFRDFIV